VIARSAVTWPPSPQHLSPRLWLPDLEEPVKKLIRYVLIIVAALWLIQNPAQAAHLARSAEHGLTHAAHSLSVIASNL
jgi:hypothetical protein